MSDLYEKSIQKLGLDQVLSLLSECAGSFEGKAACLRLQPVSDLEDVQTLLDETTAATQLCTRKGNPGFSGLHDVSAVLERANRGGCLHPKELLEIGGVLRCARTVKAYVSDDDPETILTPLFRMLVSNKYLEDRIFGAILTEEEIADTASTELADIRSCAFKNANKFRVYLLKSSI